MRGRMRTCPAIFRYDLSTRCPPIADCISRGRRLPRGCPMNVAPSQLSQIEDRDARTTLEGAKSSRRARPLNIAMVAYSFYDRDNRVMRYAEALAARGDHVDVISLAKPH